MGVALSRGEMELLKELSSAGGRARVEELSMDRSRVMALAELLKEKGIVELIERRRRVLKLTERGLKHLKEGLPEEKMIRALKERGGRAKVGELLGPIGEAELNVAIGESRRKGLIEVRSLGGDVLITLLTEKVPERELLNEIVQRKVEELEVDQEILKNLRRRGLVEVEELTEIELSLTPLGSDAAHGRVQVIEEVGKLARDMIVTGEWRKKKLKAYDVRAKPPLTYPGKPHPYVQFLDEVREILVGMGFVEVKSPIVESEFWNFDVLFQAQDHPAREVHDSYKVSYPRTLADLSRHEELVMRVARTHEDGWITGSKGWGYKWSFDIARRLILRSQTTAASARSLAGGLEVPSKIFAIDKVFRPEAPDRTHAVEFHQCEGVVLAEGMNVRHLMGFLAEFSKNLGFNEVKFKPAYFPFTEPSVEAYVKHGELGWIEIAGSGLFRPEMLIPLGYDYPKVQALAWGIGI
ncbi:MAG: phenylalanine--tRNA ligase subunit alpha, partial [Candidatus Korarchaeum sp.]